MSDKVTIKFDFERGTFCIKGKRTIYVHSDRIRSQLFSALPKISEISIDEAIRRVQKINMRYAAIKYLQWAKSVVMKEEDAFVTTYYSLEMDRNKVINKYKLKVLYENDEIIVGETKRYFVIVLIYKNPIMFFCHCLFIPKEGEGKIPSENEKIGKILGKFMEIQEDFEKKGEIKALIISRLL